MKGNGKVFRPRCKVVFEPGLAQAFRLGPPGETVGESQALDATRDVLRVVCRKRLGVPAGVFTVDLTYNPSNEGAAQAGAPASWNLILKEDNLAKIYFSRGDRNPLTGEPEDLVLWMIGLIDQVHETTTVSASGQVRRVVRVVGRDLGKLLAVHELHWQSRTVWILGAKEAHERIAKSAFIVGAPGDVIPQVLDLLLDDGEFPSARDFIIYRRPHDIDPVSLKPVIDPDTTKQEEFGFQVWANVWDRGPFWTMLQRFSDPPFVELFTDTRPDGYFSIYVRPAPFDDDDWSQLPGGAVPDTEILSHQVSRSDAERINMITIQSPWYNLGETDINFWDLYLMRWDRDSQANGSRFHGLHKLVNKSPYNNQGKIAEPKVEGGSGMRQLVVDDLMHNNGALRQLERGEGPLLEFLRRRVDTLWRWYAPSVDFYSGRFMIKGDPLWRIGYRFENQPEASQSFSHFDDERRWYYVTEVIQDYAFGSHYVTHLGVTRGQPLGRLLEPPSEGRDGPTYPLTGAGGGS